MARNKRPFSRTTGPCYGFPRKPNRINNRDVKSNSFFQLPDDETNALQNDMTSVVPFESDWTDETPTTMELRNIQSSTGGISGMLCGCLNEKVPGLKYFTMIGPHDLL